MGERFNSNEAYPVIARIIVEICETQTWATRYEIIERFINDQEGSILAKESLLSENDKVQNQVGNMVDWFSADITKHASTIEEWADVFDRVRGLVKGTPFTTDQRTREVWFYKPKGSDSINPDEETDEEAMETLSTEGKKRLVVVNRYERNNAARKACLQRYGATCQVCGFDFKEIYGDIGVGFIHVHHKIPLSKIGTEYEVDPVNDLVPVCPNCHAMLHMRKPKPYTINELKAKMAKVIG